MRMCEALENSGNPALIEGAKKNLSCLRVTFSQSVREEKRSKTYNNLSLDQGIWPLILVLSLVM